jgi:hypothetical protein
MRMRQACVGKKRDDKSCKMLGKRSNITAMDNGAMMMLAVHRRCCQSVFFWYCKTRRFRVEKQDAYIPLIASTNSSALSLSS